jgi:predicted alpha/beta-hydrolase family hydrolase
MMLAMSVDRFDLETPKGTVTAAWHGAGAKAPAVVIAHGAGAGMDHPFLVGVCEALAEEGVGALRMNFPYIEAGRKSPGAPGPAIDTVVAAVEEAGRRTRGAVFAGGKSYGGRMASMAAAGGMPCAGLVFLGYPLHPPGKPDQVRDEHLIALDVPMLFLRGTKDPFATPEVLAATLGRLGTKATHVPFEGAGHSFEIGRGGDARATGASLAPHVAAFVRDH